MEFNPSVITDAGQALITEALAGNLNIIFTKIETGDGTHAAGEDLTQLTQLTSPKQEFPLSSKEVLNSNTVHLKYVVSNVNPDDTPLTQGYYIKELGLYAKSDQAGATEVLYAVTTAIEGKADWLPPYNELQPSTITMDWYTAVGNASTVNIQDSPNAYALAGELGQVDDLNTSDKSNVVAAVNEVLTNLGALNALNLEEKSSFVAALNRLYDDVCARNAGARNGIYRGKNLGTSVTAEQWAFIQAGTFTDMFIGDYWVIDGVTWRIGGFDYWLGFGDTECTTHHILIVPDDNLLAADGSSTHYMNTSNVTTGAYIGSGFRSGTNADNTSNTARTQCLNKVKAAFGAAHILTHREHFQNAMNNGKPSGGSWYDSDVDLMNEIMVYGCPVFGVSNDGSTVPNLYTIDNSQIPLFRLNHKHISNRASWWLRDAVSATYFANVNGNGNANYSNASLAWVGVRPAFGIC